MKITLEAYAAVFETVIGGILVWTLVSQPVGTVFTLLLVALIGIIFSVAIISYINYAVFLVTNLREKNVPNDTLHN